MKILIVSHKEFEYIMTKNNLDDYNITDKKLSVISIVETFDGGLHHWFKEDHDNVLNLDFDDIEDKEMVLATYTAKGFSFDQGKKVISFLEGIDVDDCEILLIHCAAGISRSGAIGRFSNDYFRLDNGEFTRNNSKIHPNARTMRILNRLLRGIETI